MKLEILKTNEASKQALHKIFDAENTVACTHYGGGSHCNTARTDLKLKIWGGRGDKADESTCAVAKILYVDNDPAALINVGFTGASPTVLDKTGATPKQLYELSGLMVRDAYHDKMDTLAAAAKEAMSVCHNASDEYSKMFVAYSPDHPYQKNFVDVLGGTKITKENVATILGENAMHPERFAFEDKWKDYTVTDKTTYYAKAFVDAVLGTQFVADERAKLNDVSLMQCRSWAKEGTMQHADWHDSQPCIDWTPAEAYVIDLLPTPSYVEKLEL